MPTIQRAISTSSPRTAANDDHISIVQPESGGISGPGPAFRQFASIGDEIAYATRCFKAWHERGDFLGDIAVIREMVDRRLWILENEAYPNGVKYDSAGQRPGFKPENETVLAQREAPTKLSSLASPSLVALSFIGLGPTDASETPAA